MFETGPVNVSDWSVLSNEQRGDEPAKYWVTPTGNSSSDDKSDWWLFKPAKAGRESGYPQFDDVAEFLASNLARAIGLPAAEVRLAQRGGALGCISRHIAPDGELYSGDDLLSEFPEYVSIADPITRPKERVGHTLSNIRKVLRGCSGTPDGLPNVGFETFAGYLLFDAWIANTDRHAENWAIIERAGSRYLAPTFDHGRSLGSGMDETRCGTADVSRFCAAGRTKRFEGGSVSLLTHAETALALAGKPAETWRRRIGEVDDEQIDGLLQSTPRLSVVRRTFIARVLKINRERVTS